MSGYRGFQRQKYLPGNAEAIVAINTITAWAEVRSAIV